MKYASCGSATRTEWIRTGRALKMVERGVSLLKRKREAIVVELFQKTRPAVAAREVIKREARAAYGAAYDALADVGESTIAASGWPTRHLKVELRSIDIWGVNAAEVVNASRWVQSVNERGILPALVGSSVMRAAERFESLGQLLVDAAAAEQMISQLARALADTTRRVNTLEQRVAIRLAARADNIRSQLDEREREEQLRIRFLLRRRSG
ncbi:MAG: V-type ATP synthase subunit D [Gemmatimonadota bacterium]|nr:V-type ATP synthase subunit D [Gemmatimonadota bacterium]